MPLTKRADKKKSQYNKKENGKNDTGRPDKYTPDSLLLKSQEYFNFIDNKDNRMDRGISGKVPIPKTLSWLCLYLEVSKDYISEKLKDINFSETIKRIRLVVENNIEQWILMNIYNPTSGIFNLKNNFNRTDKQELEHTGKDWWPMEINNSINPAVLAKLQENWIL